MPPRGEEVGLTLVEMLVVLAIIGVIAGATVLGIGAATRKPTVAAEARKLANDLQEAADAAMVDDRPLALTWDERGYAFLPGKARHDLPAGIRIETSDVRPPLPLSVDGSGIPIALGLRSASERWLVVYDGLTAAAHRAPAT